MVIGDHRQEWNDARVASEVLRDLRSQTHAVP
jgi:hypothetical protein